MDESRRAVNAVRSIWQEGIDYGSIEDLRTPEFASAALAELVRLREETPGILEDALQGADLGASQLAVDDTHGLMEIVQNADDQAASLLRFGIRTVSGGTQLLAAHDGKAVNIRDVIAMLFAFVSTKRDIPEAAGKFGVELKTLSRIAFQLDVHCHPYHFSINGSEIEEILSEDVESFYRSSSEDTLLVLWLRDGDHREAIEGWASSWKAQHMLFLTSVIQIILLMTRKSDTGAGRKVFRRIRNGLVKEIGGSGHAVWLSRSERQHHGTFWNLCSRR